METNIGKSEVARLRQQIEMEYEAAERGLYGFAEGAAQHAFITARMENIGTCFEELRGLVGPQQAMKKDSLACHSERSEESLATNRSTRPIGDSSLRSE